MHVDEEDITRNKDGDGDKGLGQEVCRIGWLTGGTES